MAIRESSNCRLLSGGGRLLFRVKFGRDSPGYLLLLKPKALKNSPIENLAPETEQE
jgi:hypothetical protein